MGKIAENLCCGVSLQRGTKAIGYSEIIIQITGIVVYILVLLPHSEELACIMQDIADGHNSPTGYPHGCKNLTNVTITEFSEIAAVSLGTGSILIRVIELIIAFMLLKGANTRSEPKLNLWMILTLVLTVVETGTFAGQMAIEQNKLVISYTIPNILYKLYSCGVVKSFTSQVRVYNSMPDNDKFQ